MRSRNLIFLKDVFVIGLTAFGGPQAHIAVMQNVLVKKRRYLTEEELIEMNALCQMLPGPASTQTIVGIAMQRGGTGLAILALLVWMIPAVLCMSLLAVLFKSFENHGGISIKYFRFTQPVAIGIITFAGYQFGSKVIKGAGHVVLMILGLLVTVLYPTPWTFPIALAIGGLLGNFTVKTELPVPGPQPKINWTRSWLSLTLLVLIFFLAAFLGAVTTYKPFILFENFYRFGAITFGGGSALVPLMFEQFVRHNDYLTAQEFISGYAVNQAIPGPAYAFAAFTGGMALNALGYNYQALGCIISAIAIFLPGLLLMFFIFPYWQYLKRFTFIRRSLVGINAVVTGLVLGSAVLLYINLPFQWVNVFIILATFLLLRFTPVKTPYLVLLALLSGFVPWPF